MRPTSLVRAAANAPKGPLPAPAAGPSRPARPGPIPATRKSPLPKTLATPLRNNAQAQAQAGAIRTTIVKEPAGVPRPGKPPVGAAAPAAVKDKGIWQSYLALSPNGKVALGIVFFVFAGITYTMQYMIPEEKEEAVETVFERKAREALGAGAQRAGVVGQVERRPS